MPINKGVSYLILSYYEYKANVDPNKHDLVSSNNNQWHVKQAI